MPNAWEFIRDDLVDIGPLPEWVKAEQCVESQNGELTRVISEVHVNGEHTTVYLRGTRTARMTWPLTSFLRHWRPCEPAIY